MRVVLRGSLGHGIMNPEARAFKHLCKLVDRDWLFEELCKLRGPEMGRKRQFVTNEGRAELETIAANLLAAGAGLRRLRETTSTPDSPWVFLHFKRFESIPQCLRFGEISGSIGLPSVLEQECFEAAEYITSIAEKFNDELFAPNQTVVAMIALAVRGGGTHWRLCREIGIVVAAGLDRTSPVGPKSIARIAARQTVGLDVASCADLLGEYRRLANGESKEHH